MSVKVWPKGCVLKLSLILMEADTEALTGWIAEHVTAVEDDDEVRWVPTESLEAWTATAAERDTAQGALAFALESWGKERDRADEALEFAEDLRKIAQRLFVDYRREVKTTDGLRLQVRTDKELIAILDAQVAALTGQNESLRVEAERLRAPWWQRRAS